MPLLQFQTCQQMILSFCEIFHGVHPLPRHSVARGFTKRDPQESIFIHSNVWVRALLLFIMPLNYK